MGVRLLKSQCATCIFHPGNRMHLEVGRLAGMVKECEQRDTYIPCHETMGPKHSDDVVNGPASICAGFAARYEPTILQMAQDGLSGPDRTSLKTHPGLEKSPGEKRLILGV